jgi:isoquinoline 1-oxidoreductase alpha subunit
VNVNGKPMSCNVEPDTPLLWVLRDNFGLTGTKYGCGIARCGACTVLVDNQAVRSCVTPIEFVAGAVTTIEGSGATLQRVQQAWLDENVVQCGYCQGGQILSAVALLAARPWLTAKDVDDEIDRAMSGNLCRCGTYPRIKRAIRIAAGLQP